MKRGEAYLNLKNEYLVCVIECFFQGRIREFHLKTMENFFRGVEIEDLTKIGGEKDDIVTERSAIERAATGGAADLEEPVEVK